MIESQNDKTAIEWAKCFLCQKDTAETLLSSEKLRAIFKNLTGFSAIDEVSSHLLWNKSIKKEDLESTIKNYHPKHHNSCTANYGSNMLARAQNKRRKIQENEKDDSLTFSLPTTRYQSNVSVSRQSVCCFCHEIDVETNLRVAGAYHTKEARMM